MAAHTLPDSAQHMGRCAWDAARWATSRRYAEAGGPGTMMVQGKIGGAGLTKTAPY